MKLTHVLGCAAAAWAMSTSATAQEAELNPWQHCGIGAMIFPEQGILAAVSNIIWDLGTTAVISAQSSPDQCKGSRVQTAMFVQGTIASLEKEAAVGEGEYSATLMQVMQCEAGAQDQLMLRVRSSVAGVVAAPEYSDMDKTQRAEAYFNVVDRLAKTEFAGKCYAA